MVGSNTGADPDPDEDSEWLPEREPEIDRVRRAGSGAAGRSAESVLMGRDGGGISPLLCRILVRTISATTIVSTPARTSASPQPVLRARCSEVNTTTPHVVTMTPAAQGTKRTHHHRSSSQRSMMARSSRDIPEVHEPVSGLGRVQRTACGD